MTNTQMEITAREYREIQAQIKALEAKAEALKQNMISQMDELQAEELVAGEYTIRYTVYESTRLDGKKLKADRPDLYVDYIRSSTVCRFQVA